MECLLDGATLAQQELKSHRDIVENFELQLQKFETALYEYRDNLKKQT